MSLALDLMLPGTHTASCFLLLHQISTYNYTQEQCCRSKGLFSGRHLQWIDLIPPWLTNSNTFLACPSKYDSKFGFTPSTSSRKYCHSAHHCHCFCLPVRDLTQMMEGLENSAGKYPSNSTCQLRVSLRGSGQSLPSFPPN